MTTRQRSLRATPWLATLTGAVLLVGITTAPANAHNVLIDSSPEEGEEMDSVPEEVELIFNEEVLEGGNAISVVGPEDDTDFAEGAEVRLDDETAAIDIDPLTEAGDYTVEYRIISADGHPIEESISFSVSEEAASEAAAETEGNGDTAGTDDTGDGDTTDADTAAEDAAANPLTENVWLGAAVALAGIGIIVVLVVRLLRRPGPQDGAQNDNQNDETGSS